MNCDKFLKSGGGRGRPGFDTSCASCKVRWADHPKNATPKKPSTPRLKTLLKIKGRAQPASTAKVVEEDETPTSLEVEKLLEECHSARLGDEESPSLEEDTPKVEIEEEEELPAHKQPLPPAPRAAGWIGATPIIEAPKTEAIKPPLTEAEREAKVAPLLSMFKDQASTDDW